MQSKPLETGIAPIGRVRAPRRKPRLWAITLAALIPVGVHAAAATNSPAEVEVVKTNATAGEARPVRDAEPNRETQREGRDRNREPSSSPGTNTTAAIRPGQKLDFSAFKVVSERNIFDPNRNPRRPNNGNTPRPRPKVVDSISLVGVMSYDKGTFAFFDGSRGEYRKALKPSDKIGGLKVVAVDANSVKLANGEKTLELKVGSQLRREDEGEWQPGGIAEPSRTIVSSATPGAASATSAPPSSAASATPSGGDNDVLRRLMQRREQE